MQESKEKINLCWIRRDLRIHDHYALSEATKNCSKCYLLFIFDFNILNKIKNKNDHRLSFIIQSLKEIEIKLQKIGSSLIIRYGEPAEEILKVVSEFSITSLYFNRDYEPYAKKRDKKVESSLVLKNISVFHYKDHVYYEKNEILNNEGEIYKIFTPYKKKWIEKFLSSDSQIPTYKCNLKAFAKYSNEKSILNFNWHKEIGFTKTNPVLKGGTKEASHRLEYFKKIIKDYDLNRNIPSLEKTSNLSTYIRFGNLSIREMIKLSVENKTKGHETWLSEIIWRDFYQMILDSYPQLVNHALRSQYDHIKWQGSLVHFKKWCDGKTGYPIIDSAMRCLNQTGLMHNRLRMIVASFLTKILLVDWKLGEKYFSQKLLDYDLAANNGGWQWSASTGVDSQPYFRIFNPYLQSKKFDSDGLFIKSWCPELQGFSSKKIHAPHETELFEQANANCFIGKEYPHPVVSYRLQRPKALAMYKKVT